MRDFFRFVCRSALGSAIAGSTLTALICLGLFGPTRELFYLFHPLVLACFALPGFLVGFALWIVATSRGSRLSLVFRLATGMAVLPGLYFVLLLWALISQPDRVDVNQLAFLEPIVCFVVWLALIGGSAGLAAPSRKLFTKEAKLTYWERLALYEIAQQEASLAFKRHAHMTGG